MTAVEIVADAISEHYHFCDEPEVADCRECRRVLEAATRACKSLANAGLLLGGAT